MKRKTVIVIFVLFLLISMGIFVYSKLKANETFYTGVWGKEDGQEIFVPKYSYFDSACCMTVVKFYSLKSKKALDKEINEYLSTFDYGFNEDENSIGYTKDDLFINEYTVEDNILFRTIILGY